MIYQNFDKIKFIWAFFAIFLAAFLSQRFFLIFGNGFNFVLISLIVLSFFVSYLEIIFFALLGIFLINYVPGINLEVIFLFLMPQIVYFLSKKFKLQNFIGFIVFGIISFVLFYLLLNFYFIFNYPASFFYDFIVSFVFGILLFLIFRNLK